MNYVQHLIKNWKVAFHALYDFFAHFIHGLIPYIKIKHHQPYQEKKLKCEDCKMWKKRVNSEWGYCNRYNMHTPKETVLCNDEDLRKIGIRKFMGRE